MDKHEFSRQYQAYAKMLYKIAFVYLGNIQDTEEMVQEVFIKLCYSAPQFENEEHEKAWLIRVISNLCKNNLKTVWKKRVEKQEDMSQYVKEDEDLGLLELVVGLPANYKAPIYLHYYENYSVKEIGQILGLSESAVKMRLQRGRQMLKLELDY